MIKIKPKHLEAIRRQAEREYPHECCGLLIGRIETENNTRKILEIYPVANGFAEAERHHRMLIEPIDYVRAERLYGKEGLGVVGNYHSHPDDSAVPSQFDLEHLAPWSTMSYIVVSVLAGKVADVRSWELKDDRSGFTEEEIKAD